MPHPPVHHPAMPKPGLLQVTKDLESTEAQLDDTAKKMVAARRDAVSAREMVRAPRPWLENSCVCTRNGACTPPLFGVHRCPHAKWCVRPTPGWRAAGRARGQQVQAARD